MNNMKMSLSLNNKCLQIIIKKFQYNKFFKQTKLILVIIVALTNHFLNIINLASN